MKTKTKTPEHMRFAVRLRWARGKAGLTQAKASQRAGLSQSHWSDYEHGRRQPSLDMAVRLATAVKSDIGTLLLHKV